MDKKLCPKPRKEGVIMDDMTPRCVCGKVFDPDEGQLWCSHRCFREIMGKDYATVMDERLNCNECAHQDCAAGLINAGPAPCMDNGNYKEKAKVLADSHRHLHRISVMFREQREELLDFLQSIRSDLERNRPIRLRLAEYIKYIEGRLQSNDFAVDNEPDSGLTWELINELSPDPTQDGYLDDSINW